MPEVTIVREADQPDLFRFVSDRNLLAQYDFLEVSVRVALQERVEGIGHDLIREANRIATRYLCDTPGQYRNCPIYIRNSSHSPPDHAEVYGLMQEMVAYIFDNWKSKSAIHLASYVLWQLNWTHPFEEGNGRTARAMCYYVLCVGNGMWLPGSNIVPQQIRANRTPYYEALRKADAAFDRAAGKIDVSEMEAYLTRLLTIQLS